MITIRIDGRESEIWVTDDEQILPKSAENWIRYSPQFLKPRPFKPRFFYRVKLLMEAWSLTYTVDQLVRLNSLVAIDTAHKMLYTKSGRPVRADISVARLSERDTDRVQTERLIHALNRSTEALVEKKTGGQSTAPESEITGALLWRVREAVENQLDNGLNALPSHSDFFKRYCKDRLSYEQMNRKLGWKKRTLANRKKRLNSFLRKEFRLSVDSFMMADRSIFREADKLLNDHRARYVNPRHVAGQIEDTDE